MNADNVPLLLDNLDHCDQRFLLKNQFSGQNPYFQRMALKGDLQNNYDLNSCHGLYIIGGN